MKNLGELNNRKRYNLIVQDAIQSTDMSNWDFSWLYHRILQRIIYRWNFSLEKQL